MKGRQAVKRYARMFLNSVGVEAVPGALDQLSAVNELMEKSAGFRGVLLNPLFTEEERKGVMKELSGKLNLSESTVGFILSLSANGLISSLAVVIQILTALYLEKKKRAKAMVVTPVDTGGKYDDVLKSSLKRLTGRDIEIEYVIDPSLLGGVLVKVGSTMYDSSIKGQLRLLKDDLVKR